MTFGGQFLRIEAQGLRDQAGRFARATEEGLRAQRQLVRQGLLLARVHAERLTPVGPGSSADRDPDRPRMRDSWRTAVRDTGDGAEGTLRNVAPHSDWVQRGTRPHIIEARGDFDPGDPDVVSLRQRGLDVAATAGGDRPRLRFVATQSADVVFRDRVRHPGSRPNPVVQRAWLQVQSLVELELRRASQRVAAYIAGGGGAGRGG